MIEKKNVKGQMKPKGLKTESPPKLSVFYFFSPLGFDIDDNWCVINVSH